MSVATNQTGVKVLGAMQPGSRCIVDSVAGGRGIQAYLADIGIFKGAEIRIIANLLKGPVLMEVKGAKYTLGRGMVEKIWVR